ncbi:hypothetical protein IXB50_00290 [Leptothoe spongobia TAU-MAC 1115]|uniref:TonB C-terminal domain-containing protein n=1 Tax=Leptothoe spongobia TAU-MAC 1115 TaxID=1967444 RepID=A0A947DB92_9CYAN|nr:hypothetical protein [Leptothoe spongobia TAU-MAC 1115]
MKLLFNPIFLLAAGLHAGLLLIPVAGGSSEGLVPAPDPEGESISVTRIPPKAAKPSAGQTVAPKATANRLATARPATTTQAPTGGKPGTDSNNQQKRSQARSQGGQQRSTSSGSSSNRGSNTGSRTTNNRSNSRNNRSNQTARNTPTPGLPDLPNNTNTGSDPVPVTVPTGESATQKPPTLTALRDGTDAKAVPRLLKDFLARLQYSLQETRDVATAEAQQAWLTTLEGQPDIQVSAIHELEKSLEISYPLMLEDNGPRQLYRCLSPLPKTGLVGIVVDATGEIATEPTLLRSSGYPFLNDIALGKIKDYSEFPDEAVQKIYAVPVEVKYNEDACVSLAKLGVASPETTTQPRTTPTPPEGSRNFLEEDNSPSPFRR